MSTSVSSVVSHFPDAENGFTTTTAGSVSSGAGTVTLNSVAGYTNGEPVVLVIDPTDAAKKQTFTGIVDTSGVQITSVVWTAGTNQTHALGATVVDYATATHIAMISKGIKVEHAQAGTHTNITQADANYIKDDAGNELLKWSKTASAVNEVTIKNAATATDPRISASGGDTNVNLNLRGKGLAKTVTIGAGAATIFPYDYVVSGCVLSGDSYGSTLNFSMTSGVVVINGNPVTVASFSASAATASKDTYVDVLDNGDGTGLVVKTGGNIVNNNAASPALASNSIRLGIVVSGAGNIASAASVNQGEESKVLPIASSIPYAVTDSLGNLICPRDPNRKILGYRQILSNFTTTSATVVQVTGLTCPVIVPTGRKVKITGFTNALTQSASPKNGYIYIYDTSVAGTALQVAQMLTNTAANGSQTDLMVMNTPASASKTFVIGAQSDGASTLTVAATSTAPTFIMVELV